MGKILPYTQGDQLPALQVFMQRKHPITKKLKVVDLTTAVSVAFRAKIQGAGTTSWKAAGTIVDAPAGEVQMEFGSAFLDTVGVYEVEVEIIWADAKPETYPSYVFLDVRAQFADPP